MTSDNVHHLPNTAAAQALTLARAYQPDYLDRLLAEERRNLAVFDKGTAIIDELAAAGRAVWLRRDAEARAEQAERWAVRLEQQLGEIERVAVQWAAIHGIRAGMGNLILDIIRGHRSDEGGAA